MSYIYLAARFGRMAELQEHKRDLEERGHIVTSRWMLGGHDAATDSKAETDQEFAVRCANEDLDDLNEANVLICFTEPPQTGVGRNRGGRHVEFGYALALGTKRILDCRAGRERLPRAGAIAGQVRNVGGSPRGRSAMNEPGETPVCADCGAHMSPVAVRTHGVWVCGWCLGVRRHEKEKPR